MGNRDIGMIGMSVMGSNLCQNMADHGFLVSGYDFDDSFTTAFEKDHQEAGIVCFHDLGIFLQSLRRPRKVMMMVRAGKPVDDVLGQVVPLLEAGDIVIDGGNSFFRDTERRSEALRQKGIVYFGVGVSGGAEGARKGPALMPGGEADAYPHIRPIFEAVAAHVEEDSCCAYIGSGCAGHYVKMVHNGIEYADMQLIAESYLLLKHLGGCTNAQMAGIYHQWDGGELASYLVRITADVLAEKEDGCELIDQIRDSAGQKGTGRWTSIAAMEQGVDISVITAACNARILSNQTEWRRKMAEAFATQETSDSLQEEDFVETVQQALYAAKIVAYAQGFSLYRSASEVYGWHLDYAGIASIFRGGCIIQARLLSAIMEAFHREAGLGNLLMDPCFIEFVEKHQQDLRKAVAIATEAALPIPAMAAALTYLDGLRATCVGANLIQAQRDCFGAHTFQRVDREGTFHHAWGKHF